MQSLRNTLIVSGNALVVLVLITLAGCSKDPYEVEVERFYYETTKSSVNIIKVTVDTAVSFDQARPWLVKKLERVKERKRAAYAERFDQAVRQRQDPSLVKRWKERLDSANAGLFSPTDHEIAAFSLFETQQPKFEQLTLRYKVWSQGDVLEQVFIRTLAKNDTTLRVTEKGVKDFLMY